MKIAFFSDCYLDLTGGIVTCINAEKAELEKLGHTVYVFSSAFPCSNSNKLKLAKDHIFPVPSCKFFGKGLTPIARRPKIVEKYILKNFPEIKDFDIFYIHYEAGCSIAGLRLAKNLKISSIQVMHGREDISIDSLVPFGLRTVAATLLNWSHSWYLPHKVKVKKDHYLADTISRAKMWTLMINHANYADMVFTPSEHFLKKLQHYGLTKPAVAIHHGVSNSLINKNITPKSFSADETLNIIWHSRVAGGKNIMLFLEALNILQNQHQKTNYHFYVYGSGNELGKAKRYVKKHQLKVTFYGDSKFDKIWQQIQKSHLDVLVSYNFDTFGMTLIEAQAAGVPNFIIDPDMKEILPPESYIIAKEPTSKQMASALLNIFDHPEIINRMSKKAIAAIDEIDVSHKIQKVEKIMKTLP